MKIKRVVVTAILAVVVLVLLTGCGNLSPIASFTCIPTSGEAPLNVSFDASVSSDSDGSITYYGWRFGDGKFGGVSSPATASHSYTVPGTYTIRLIVTDDDGSTCITAHTIYVSPSSVGSDKATIQETTTPEQLWSVFGNSSRHLSESTQRKIFYDMIATQDQNPYSNEWNQSVKQAAADSYNVPMSQISDIIQKGATEGWLQPDPP